MVAYNFNLPIYGFDQWSGASTNNTVQYQSGTSFSLNPGAALTIIEVEDDDGNPAGSPNNAFSDGYIDVTGDGSPSNTANNDQVLTQPVTINGTTYQAGDQVELEFAFTTTTGETFWIIRIDGTNVGISGPTLPVPGTSYTVASSQDGQQTPIENIPCFVSGSLIETSRGLVKVEDISVNDLVLTKDNGFQPVRWVGKRQLDSVDLALSPNIRPIKISAGALGDGIPSQDLFVSPQHRVLASSNIVRRMFGTNEVLVSAKSLLALDGVDAAAPADTVCYVHLLFDAHQVIFSNGALTESLYLGPEALKSVPEKARDELLLLFPELKDSDFKDVPAAHIPSGQRQRGMIARHVKNGRYLVS